MQKNLRQLLAGLLVLILAPCLYADKANRHGGRGKPSTGGLNITAAALPDGTVGAAYSQTLAASGGTAPYTWAITGCSGATGCLPPPLTLGAITGTIAGMPTAAGTYSFTVTVTDSAAHSYSSAFGLTIAGAGGATLFSDGFESGNLAAWSTSSLWTTNNPVVQSGVKHTGTYAYGQLYYVCGDSTNPACGSSHADSNRYVSKYGSDLGYPNGIDHFFIRGYVYLKTPESGGSKDIQRKLFYLMSPTGPNHPVYEWAALVTSFATAGSGDKPSICTTVVNDVADDPARNYFPSGYLYLNYDTWYSVELEVQKNTPGTCTGGPFPAEYHSNGIMRLWVNGTLAVEKTDACFVSLGTYTSGITQFQVGDQADRDNYLVIDEYRYLDDIKIGTAYIGP